MIELVELTKELKEPPRKTIEDAIRAVLIRVEELPDTTGIMFPCGDMRALAWAAQRCLEAGPLPGETKPGRTTEQVTASLPPARQGKIAARARSIKAKAKR